MSRFPRFLLLAMTTMLVGATIFTSGCGDSGHAQLRVVHASPDAPNVDVLVDGKIVLTNVAYEAASNYLTVSAGSRMFAQSIRTSLARTPTPSLKKQRRNGLPST